MSRPLQEWCFEMYGPSADVSGRAGHAVGVQFSGCQRPLPSSSYIVLYKVELLVDAAYTGVVWEVEYTDEFEQWWLDLTETQQEALDDRVMLLAEVGPGLKRPTVGDIQASRHRNMKELRVSQGGALRVLFAFDPRRHAILLLGGDKSGQWKQWYRTAIPAADDLYDIHLKELADEYLLDGGE